LGKISKISNYVDIATMPETPSHTQLLPILNNLNRIEDERLSYAATRSTQAVRRQEEERSGYRQAFSLDADRIIHSRAYTRYIDKTQVFCLVSMIISPIEFSMYSWSQELPEPLAVFSVLTKT